MRKPKAYCYVTSDEDMHSGAATAYGRGTYRQGVPISSAPGYKPWITCKRLTLGLTFAGNEIEKAQAYAAAKCMGWL